MKLSEIQEEYINALADLDEIKVFELTEKKLNAGEDPLEILNDVKRAMDIVGKRFEDGWYFVADLMMAGEILNKLTDMIKPRLKKSNTSKLLGKVVIGTVKGDIHDIGKDIVITMFEANDFEVIDLGVDVHPDKFVEAIQKHQPQIVGMSALLTSAFGSMRGTVKAIEEAGLRNQIKIIIGGGTIDEDTKDYVGADAYCRDPVAAINLAKKWVKGE